MFESRVSVGAQEKLTSSERLDANISAWSSDVEDHSKKCAERFCEFAIQQLCKLYKVATPCMDDHQVKENGSVGELSTDCSRNVLKFWYVAFVGKPDILWSVNKFARSITKWTKACDKRLNWFISYIHHTCEYRQYCHVGILPNNADWDCFTTLTSLEILKIQNPLLEVEGVHCDQVVDECKIKQSDSTWILVRRDEEGLRQCSALVDRRRISVLARGGQKVSILFEYELSSSIRVFLNNSRTFRSTINLALQDAVLLPEGFTA